MLNIICKAHFGCKSSMDFRPVVMLSFLSGLPVHPYHLSGQQNDISDMYARGKTPCRKFAAHILKVGDAPKCPFKSADDEVGEHISLSISSPRFDHLQLYLSPYRTWRPASFLAPLGLAGRTCCASATLDSTAT